jgi:chromosome segregation ATPase
LAVVEQRWE